MVSTRFLAALTPPLSLVWEIYLSGEADRSVNTQLPIESVVCQAGPNLAKSQSLTSVSWIMMAWLGSGVKTLKAS